MSTTYTPAKTFPVSFVVPDDGDPKTASSLNVGLEAVGDRTQYLYYRGGAAVFDYGAMRAILAPVDGDRIYTIFGGDYVFKSLATGPEDVPISIKATDGTVGSWLQSAITGIWGQPGGVPRLDATSKVADTYLRNRIVSKDSYGPEAYDEVTTSTSFVDVPKGSGGGGGPLSFTMNANAGDILFVRAAFFFDYSTSVMAWRSFVSESGGATFNVDRDCGASGSYYHEFKYVVAATGTLTLKGQFKAYPSGGGSAFLHRGGTCLSYELVRP